MAQKAVQTITLALGATSFTGRLAGATVFKGATTELDKIAAFGDSAFTSVPRTTVSFSDFKFTVLDDGTSAALADLAGTVVSATVTTTFSDGKTAASPVAQTFDLAVSGVEPGDEIMVDGERKATIVITGTPHAPAAVVQQGSGTTEAQ